VAYLGPKPLGGILSNILFGSFFLASIFWAPYLEEGCSWNGLFPLSLYFWRGLLGDILSGLGACLPLVVFSPLTLMFGRPSWAL